MALTQVPNSMLSTGAPSWDTSGNVGIGTTSPAVTLDIYNATTAVSRTQGDSTVQTILQRASTDSQAGFALLRKSRGTIAAPTAVATGDIMGSVQWQAYGGTTIRSLATLASVVETYTSDTDISSYMRFSTTPAGSVTNVERMRIDSSGIVTGTAGNLMLVQGNSQASTSGTSITFLSIPSWVKKITVMFNSVSTNGTSYKQVQIGSGSLTTTGYTSSSTTTGSSSATATSTTGFIFGTPNVTDAIYGTMTIVNVSGNIWVVSHSEYANSTPQSAFGGGGVTLSGVLDRLAMTTINGTDTFDAGSINIQWE